MVIQYKKKCSTCNKNYVLITRRIGLPVCFECQKRELDGEIKDPEMKKMFDIPVEYYQQNSFLRNIKISYLRYESLSERQIDAFRKTVDEMKIKLASLS